MCGTGPASIESVVKIVQPPYSAQEGQTDFLWLSLAKRSYVVDIIGNAEERQLSSSAKPLSTFFKLHLAKDVRVESKALPASKFILKCVILVQKVQVSGPILIILLDDAHMALAVEMRVIVVL